MGRISGDSILQLLGVVSLFMGKKKRAVLEGAADVVDIYPALKEFRRQVRDSHLSRTPLMLDVMALDTLEAFFQKTDRVVDAVENLKRK